LVKQRAVILARLVFADRAADLALASSRLGLAPSEREALERAGQVAILLTGLSAAASAFLSKEGGPAWVPGSAARPGSGILAGRREQVEALLALARSDPGQEELARALGAALAGTGRRGSLRVGGRTFEIGERTYLMGVVNVTQDSFSDGGRYLDPAAAIAHGEALARAGADLVDVGGESTRPGAQSVGADEELARILPVIRGLRERIEVPISVDTTKAEVARAALEAGASLVNDISGLRFDPELAPVAARAGAACCLMHIQGTPRTMQASPRYGDLVEEIVASLTESVSRAEQAGIPRDRLLVDPGIGFGKTFAHNLFLLRRLGELRVLGLPVLVGTSRKAFLGALTGGKPPGERVVATAATVAIVAAAGGADFVRVHDVAEAKDAAAVGDAVRTALDAGELFSPPG